MDAGELTRWLRPLQGTLGLDPPEQVSSCVRCLTDFRGVSRCMELPHPKPCLVSKTFFHNLKALIWKACQTLLSTWKKFGAIIL